MKEEKREHFRRIAEARVRRICSAIDTLGNCSNRGYYEWTPEQISKIFRAIQEATDTARRKFEPQRIRPFTLEDRNGIESRPVSSD